MNILELYENLRQAQGTLEAGKAVAALIDHKSIAFAFDSKKETFFRTLSARISSKIQSLPPHETISFRLMKGEQLDRIVWAAPTPEYAAVLIAFLTGSKHANRVVDSYITPIVLKAAEEVILEFYTGQDAQEILSKEFSRQFQGNKVMGKLIRGEIASNTDWLAKEIAIQLKGEAASSFTTEMIDALSQKLAIFLASATGKALIGGIAKVLGGTAGKYISIYVTKYVTMGISKALAAGFLKTAVGTFIKKVGIGLLLKTAIGKALLLALGITSVPIVWIILPIIAGWMVVDYLHFPGKLAKQLSEKVEGDFRSKFSQLNEAMVGELVQYVMGTVVDEATNLKN